VPLLDQVPNAVKAGAGVIAAIGVIIGGYVSVESWAAEQAAKVTEEIKAEMAIKEAKNALVHDRMYQTQRGQNSEIQIKILERELEDVELEIQERIDDGKEPSLAQERQRERLLEAIDYHEQQLRDARNKIEHIDTPPPPED
jgi:VIT1/CCC1 family predicted Fe2+/Mn2+ transporter